MDSVIAIIAIICTIGLPVVLGIYLVLKKSKLQHLERMEMIRQGLIPPSKEGKNGERVNSLQKALVLIGVGLGLGVGLIISKVMQLSEDNAFWAVGPSIVFFLGIGYLLYFILAPKYAKEEEKTDDLSDKE